ncbi:hypothetical protein HDU79_011395 [Rhizoclosmatium sp. JEL0117]|nr:hypothetical protein HDU79_011395 [Rhizoclosmatium sp. JEL0117]
MSFLRPPPQSAPLKHHLLYWFILCALASLFLSEVIALSFIGGSLASLTNTASNLLTTQAANSLASSIVSNSAQLFEDVLTDVIYAVTVLSTATGDSFRPDYSTGQEPSFYGAPESLDNPVVQPSNADHFPGLAISTTHSVWILAGYNETSNGKFTPPSLNSSTTNTLNQAAHVDTFVRPIYKLSPEVLSVQIGFEDSGLLKSFPGTGDNLNLGAYDPRTRSWYSAAVKNQATPASYAITAPYLSAFGRGWLVGTAKTFYNKVDGSLAGVATVNTKLSDLSGLLESYTYGNSNVAVFTADQNGFMLASTKTNFNIIDQGTPNYSFQNTSNPLITDGLWNQIVSSSSKDINTLTSNYGSTTYTDPQTGVPYLILWKTLSIYASDSAAKSQTPSWVAVGSVPITELQSIVDSTTSNLKKALPLSIGISFGVFAGTTLVVLLLVILFANQVVKPFQILSQESSRVSNNIGNKDLWEGVQDKNVSRSGVDEMDKLKDSFYEMVKRVREASLQNQAQRGDVIENKTFAKKSVGQDSIEVQSVLDLLPEHPPQYHEVFPQGRGGPSSSRPQPAQGSFLTSS